MRRWVAHVFAHVSYAYMRYRHGKYEEWVHRALYEISGYTCARVCRWYIYVVKEVLQGRIITSTEPKGMQSDACGMDTISTDTEGVRDVWSRTYQHPADFEHDVRHGLCSVQGHHMPFLDIEATRGECLLCTGSDRIEQRNVAGCLRGYKSYRQGTYVVQRHSHNTHQSQGQADGCRGYIISTDTEGCRCGVLHACM
jgi:hypothetical protein